MTLTELRYVLALANERHFGRAAENCFVSQPTLSVAIKKLEEELNVVIFERGSGEISLTPIGEQLVEQAQRVLEEADALRQLAAQGRDPLAGTLRVGLIYTIAPYLLPHLIPRLRQHVPQMDLVIEENFTARLAEMLRRGELDVLILSQPFLEPSTLVQAVYDEPFVLAIPPQHRWQDLATIPPEMLEQENVLLLGAGNCFRDQVLKVCPSLNRSANSIQKTLEGSSLQTIRHMVACGMGVTVLPVTAADFQDSQGLLQFRHFAGQPVPSRRIVLAWRKRFSRLHAIEALRQTILACPLPHVEMLDSKPMNAEDF